MFIISVNTTNFFKLTHYDCVIDDNFKIMTVCLKVCLKFQCVADSLTISNISKSLCNGHVITLPCSGCYEGFIKGLYLVLNLLICNSDSGIKHGCVLLLGWFSVIHAKELQQRLFDHTA